MYRNKRKRERSRKKNDEEEEKSEKKRKKKREITMKETQKVIMKGKTGPLSPPVTPFIEGAESGTGEGAAKEGKLVPNNLNMIMITNNRKSYL